MAQTWDGAGLDTGLDSMDENKLNELFDILNGLKETKGSEDLNKAAFSIIKKYGFKEEEKAFSNLKTFFPEIERPLFIQLLKAVLSSPNKDRALNGLEQALHKFTWEGIKPFIKAYTSLKNIAVIMAASPYLTQIILKNYNVLAEIFLKGGLFKEKSLSVFVKELSKFTEGADNAGQVAKNLRQYKQREYLRIGARDLCGIAPFEDISRELSDLASASLEVAFNHSIKSLKCKYGSPMEFLHNGTGTEARFSVVAMGKFGGRELNFSSDIDIIYLYSSDKGETTGIETPTGIRGKIDLHTFFIKLSEMITRLIGQTTDEGFVFRVDLGLRPEGENGDLANSLRSMEIYYESWGQTWERGALIKARPVAGSLELGRRFIDMVMPFVYRRYLDFTAIEDIKGMKERIDHQIVNKKNTLDIKLGRGGIREIEFFVQALQLINGGKNPNIREVNTLKALEALKSEGYIADDEAAELSKIYVFFRDVEHRLQIIYCRQTQTLLEDKDELNCIAKTLRPSLYDAERLIERLRTSMERVHSIYNRLFYDPSRALKEEVDPYIIAIFEEGFSQDETKKILLKKGFKDLDRALSNIKLLKEGRPFIHYSPKARQCLKKMAPYLFLKVLEMPDQGLALSNLERFLAFIGPNTTYLSLLSENREVMEALVNLFGTSAFLSRFLIEHPGLLDNFITGESRKEIKDKSEMTDELNLYLSEAGDYEEALNLLRRYRNTEVLRIGVNDINRRIKAHQVSEQMSCLADVCLEKALEIAWKELSRRYGEPVARKGDLKEKIPFCIIGLGKLGGTELLYGSDLDIIFIYLKDGETDGELAITAHEFFARLAQKIISILTTITKEGYVFKIDTRLRPSGSSGPIVTSFSAFERYHKETAQIWEKQALLKARFIVGDKPFGKAIISAAWNIICEKPLTIDDEKEIKRLRLRMEKELGKEDDSTIDIKFGRGGMVDIEFIVQALQLRYGRKNKDIRGANTINVIKKLEKKGLLSQKDCRFLSYTYSFYRGIENRLRIIEDRANSKINVKEPKLINILRSLNCKDIMSFLDVYNKKAAGVRMLYNTLLHQNSHP